MTPLFSGDRLACLRGERLVFRDLDFGVDAGGALILTGRNGSGKSSLLRLMAGLLRPWSGTLAWSGVTVADNPEAHRDRIGFVGHLDAVKPVLTAVENLALWARLGGASPTAALDALGRFELAHLASLPGRYLSAGQKRRLNLARLLVRPAALWLLDEPTVGLDRRAVGQLEATLATHRAAGGVVVLSTHTSLDLPDADTLDLDCGR